MCYHQGGHHQNTRLPSLTVNIIILTIIIVSIISIHLKALRENYFFGGFHYREGEVRSGTDHFRAHNFFVPFIDSVSELEQRSVDVEKHDDQAIDSSRLEEGDLMPRIYIVPMRVPRAIRY